MRHCGPGAADVAAVTLVAAVPLALGAAGSFGAAGFMQHRAARHVPRTGPLQPKLLRELVAVPLFRWGIVCSAVAFVLQVIALWLAPLAVVQPLLVTGVLFYLGFASWVLGHRPDRLITTGAAIAVAGIAVFVVFAGPAAGTNRFSGTAALPLGIGLVAVVVAALAIAVRVPGEYRALPFAAATAVCYGVTAGLLRGLLTSPDLTMVWRDWQLYAVLVVAPAGFLLNQNAFQRGAVGSVAVAVITVGDPVVSIGVGAAWLGESLAGGALHRTLQVLALVAMAVGIALLARRAQQVADQVSRIDEPAGAA